MIEKGDIKDGYDVKKLVDSFYTEVKQDELLSPIFMSRIAEGDWASHLERIYAFWNAILFAEVGFTGNPMEKHLDLPVGQEHFNRWMNLFENTVDKHFKGPKADEAKKRASSIASIISLKLINRQIK